MIKQLKPALACALAVAAGAVAAAPAEARTDTVRKSASDMSRTEIDRFKRAFSYAVRKGYLDRFSAEHFDHMRHRHHGADLLSGAPPAVMAGGGASWGHRLLPWHRAFLLEAEKMLRAALRERNRKEGRDPREADKLSIPYWDAAHDQDLPGWVRSFNPKGGTAQVPEGVPKGHAAYGKPVGSRYKVRFGRWPGRNISFDRLPRPDQISRMLAQPDFKGFLSALDLTPEIVPTALPGAKRGLETLTAKLPDDPDVRTITASMDPAAPKDQASQLATFNALLAVGHMAPREAAKARPDRELIAAVEAVYAAFRFPPHLVLHLWAGGLDPKNPDVRGTVTYFNELAVDPVFWMLHAELDRWWYTWEQSHAEAPALTGEDAVFEPLTGGRRYELSWLTATSGLPYRYDATFRGPMVSTPSRARVATATLPGADLVCHLG